jgi:hypothetical protein
VSQSLDDEGVLVRDEVFVDQGAERGADPPGRCQVLGGHRQAMERTDILPTRKRPSEALIGGARVSHGPFRDERDDGVYARVGTPDLLQARRHRLYGRQFPRG